MSSSFITISLSFFKILCLVPLVGAHAAVRVDAHDRGRGGRRGEAEDGERRGARHLEAWKVAHAGGLEAWKVADEVSVIRRPSGFRRANVGGGGLRRGLDGRERPLGVSTRVNPAREASTEWIRRGRRTPLLLGKSERVLKRPQIASNLNSVEQPLRRDDGRSPATARSQPCETHGATAREKLITSPSSARAATKTSPRCSRAAAPRI